MNKSNSKEMNDAEEVVELKDKKEIEADKKNKVILIAGISILVILALCVCGCFCLTMGLPFLGSSSAPGPDYYYNY